MDKNAKSEGEVPCTTKEMIYEIAEKLEYPAFDLPPNPELQRNLDKERKWLEEMTTKAEKDAVGPDTFFSLGQYYYLRQNHEKAIDYFEKASTSQEKTAGSVYYDIQAAYQLGVMYYDGLGVSPDAEKGSRYMLQLASSGDSKSTSHIIASAQYNMGRAYFMGFGVKQSDQEAEKWWLTAAKQGSDPSSIRAKHTLGLFYTRPESFNIGNAFKWHKEAAEGGHTESMAVVGVLYDVGEGCGQDREEALSWLRRSCREGSIYGTGLLARHYYDRKMFLRATETAYRVSEIDQSGPPHEGEASMEPSQMDRTGVAISCFIMGRCLELGLGLDANLEKAKHYYSKATAYDKITISRLHALRVLGQM